MSALLPKAARWRKFSDDFRTLVRSKAPAAQAKGWEGWRKTQQRLAKMHASYRKTDAYNPTFLQFLSCLDIKFDGRGIRDDQKGSGKDPMHINRARYLRVLIAADHPPSIGRIRGLVFPDFDIVGTVDGVGEQAVRRAFELKPDIILVEVALAIKDHFEAVAAMSQQLPHTWIIFFQNEAGSPSAVPSNTSTVLRCRNRAASTVESEPTHATSPARRVINGAHQHPAIAGPQELTGREYEVLALLVAGYPMKQIGDRLGITYRTVTFHKYRMMGRLGISSSAGLIAYALKNAPTKVSQGETATAA
jgi:DNA-binding NarL/FixJ family response regulator